MNARTHHTTFKRIRWKNLFSYGNTWTTIDLDRSPSTVITGKNGAGKSVLFEALHIAITGTSIRPIKKATWVNNKNNKGMVIELAFDVGADQYELTRGVKPDVFTITKNGEPLNQEASVKDMQTILYRDILRSDKVGTQITTLVSKSGIQMFMSLKAEERRRFIDNMLGCSVFTDMAKLHKLQVDKHKPLVEQCSNALIRQQATVEGKVQEIEGAREMVVTMTRQHKAQAQQMVTEAERAVQAAEDRLKTVEDSGDYHQSAQQNLDDALARQKAADGAVVDAQLLQQLQDAQHLRDMAHDDFVEVDVEAHQKRVAKVAALEGMQGDLQVRIRVLQGSLDSLKEGFCDSCKQEVGVKHITAERAKVTPKLQQAKDTLAEMEAKLKELRQQVADTKAIMETNAQAQRDRAGLERDVKRTQDMVAAAEERIADAKADADKAVARAQTQLASAVLRKQEAVEQATTQVEAAKRHLMVCQKRLSDPPQVADRVPELEAQLATLQKELDRLSAERQELGKKTEYFTLLTTMLKDSGVKTVIVKRFLPIVNRVVNEKLAEMGFHAKFTMDENFDESILVNGNAYTFHQFSEGEKLRINLGLIMAWREVARMQGRMDSNLLMFDEQLDGSLDDDGYEALTDIFKLLGDLNVFIISHNSVKMENFVRTKLAFTKANGFSRVGDVIDA